MNSSGKPGICVLKKGDVIRGSAADLYVYVCRTGMMRMSVQRPAPTADGGPPGKRMRTVQPLGAQPVRRISNNLPVITTLAQQLQVKLSTLPDLSSF